MSSRHALPCLRRASLSKRSKCYVVTVRALAIDQQAEAFLKRQRLQGRLALLFFKGGGHAGEFQRA